MLWHHLIVLPLNKPPFFKQQKQTQIVITIDIRNIDCLTACVFFISTVNGRSKKRRKEAYYELR